jgi:hypothetical protein
MQVLRAPYSVSPEVDLQINLFEHSVEHLQYARYY